eukprot:TRINITY_DN39850_c0_g1_i1.p1 TRINITY_DN39850_c0_g1~~TRINITY_DN39850_c0_g1_i1.p1  ORF type:complete len:484 (+),score=69.22 TRINITY_DN39850_c0_g1_i1:68-1519(+)
MAAAMEVFSRGRRHSAGVGVKDCLGQRNGGETLHIGLAKQQDLAAGARNFKSGGRPPRTESVQELLNQLPVALGGHRLPAGGSRTREPSTGASGRASPGEKERPSRSKGHSNTVGASPAADKRRSNSCEASSTLKAGTAGFFAAKDRLPALAGDPARPGSGENTPVYSPFLPEPQGGGDKNARRRSRETSQAYDPRAAHRAVADMRGVQFVSRADEPNRQFRDYMEDRHVLVEPFMHGECVGEAWTLLAIYDGHGGAQAAEHCASEMHRGLAQELRIAMREQRGVAAGQASLRDEVIADAFTRAFQKIDDQLKAMGSFRYGCTATVVLVRRMSTREGTGVRIHCANVGDSRAITFDNQRETRLSQDHRPTDASEARRVQQAGGFVSMGRVSGELAVSRALGDHSLKGAGVTWRPHVSHRDASREVAVVLASDGLWDTLGDRDVRSIVEQSGRQGMQEQVAQVLVEDAKRRGSTDNIACLVGFL